ncbi:hypothetical protein BUPH_05949 [Paraburkholderia phenoliruptrix BR3459a]|uniref:Uncharacterized protein n=1 Tax=Paraburkholderia phenoliruptrix BR3459a TaxID=1229205 RepID=K0DYK2_9BURK|nr:hypothetical protein BUPH_05949 [Paraburkholderia phenoliruptrix BR3459a]
MRSRGLSARTVPGYWSLLAIRTNLAARFVPTLVTPVMMTSAMSVAIRPYSMAVTPSSSRTNALAVLMIDFMVYLP